MAEAALKEHLKEIIAKTLGRGISAEDIQDDTPLKDLSGDSMAALEVIMELERDYGVVIYDQETAEKVLETIVTLADYVEANRQQ